MAEPTPRRAPEQGRADRPDPPAGAGGRAGHAAAPEHGRADRPDPPAGAVPGGRGGRPGAAGGAPAAREATRSQEVFAPPPVDIYEDEQGLVVVADLPGVEPGALDVRVEQGVLTIQGRTQALATGTPLHREYELPGFFRQFQLPEEIETGRIEAALTQGVLTLRLPRAAPAPPRRIAVRPA